LTEATVLEALAAGRLPDVMAGVPIPRLRFDRVALRVIRDLRENLADAVPERHALIVTVTAPIREPSCTVAALIARIGDDLATGSFGSGLDETICANRVCARAVATKSSDVPRVIVFVCNPEPPPSNLLDAITGLLK
jgi:hypothetical protein